MNALVYFNSIKGVEREFEIAMISVQRLIESSRSDTTFIRSYNISVGELQHCHKMLEQTYVIRLYAEFEACLREYWRIGLKRNSIPRMEHLINSVAAYRGIQTKGTADAHSVRNYRNNLIHHVKPGSKIDLRTCRGRLTYFLSFLPIHW